MAEHLPMLTDLVQDKFSYLFSEYGFKLLESKEVRTSRTYYIIAESTECRILFTYEANWGIFFGELGTAYTPSWSGWIAEYSIFKFLGSDLPISSPQKNHTRIYQHSFKAERLGVLAKAVKKDMKQIIALFKLPDVIAKLKFP